MTSTELLKLIKEKERQCEEVLSTSSDELDFLTNFYRNNSLSSIDGMLTVDFADFTTAYIMSFVTNEDRDEAFNYIKKSVDSISGILNNLTEEQIDDLIDLCDNLIAKDLMLVARDLFADPNRRRSKLNLRRKLVGRVIDEDTMEFLFQLTERENSNVAELFNLFIQVEEPFENALCMIHDMKSLRDDYEKFNEALEIYGPKNKERKFLVQSWKNDYDISEILKDFRHMRSHYEELAKTDSTKRKTANKELSYYKLLEQKIVQALQKEEITAAKTLLTKINDPEIRLAILKLVYEHNKEYYDALIEEHRQLSLNSSIHYQTLLQENNINIDVQTIMHNKVEDVKRMIITLRSVMIVEPIVVGRILQITDVETFDKLMVYFANGTLKPSLVEVNPNIFDKKSDEFKNFLVNIRMIKDQSINPRNFNESQFIFISDPSLVQRNIEFLKAYSFEKSINKDLDYHFLLNPSLLEILDKMLELGLEKFLEEDLSILNYYKNLNRIRVIKELNIPITSLEQLKEILTTETFLLADEDILKYVEQIDTSSIKMDSIPDEITRLRQFEQYRTYNINGVIISKNRVKRNYSEADDVENKTLYSILHNSIMTQTEYETVKQSLTNSLTYK